MGVQTQFGTTGHFWSWGRFQCRLKFKLIRIIPGRDIQPCPFKSGCHIVHGFCLLSTMDVVSAVASIATLVDLTTTVIGYIKSAKEAGEERKKLLRETSGTLNFLVLLKNRAEEKEWANTLRIIALPNGPVQQFRIALQRLASKLSPVGGVKSLGKPLTWYFQKEEINEILSSIERQKSLFSLALENDHM